MAEVKDWERENGSDTEQEQVDSTEPRSEPEEAVVAEESPEAAGNGGDFEALLAEKDERIRELNERLLRAVAEADNTRKRLEKERREAVCFANESILRELLNVLDNLERAVLHGEESGEEEGLLEGVRMTVKSFHDALGKFGCKAIESIGSPFDPNYHEAISQMESADYPAGVVMGELRKGYTLNDRLLRAALVIVAKSPASASEGSGGDAGDGDSEPADTGSRSAGG